MDQCWGLEANDGREKVRFGKRGGLEWVAA